MKTLKSIGGILLGIVIFIGIIITSILLLTLGAKIAFIIEPFINWLAGILLIINIIALVISAIPNARGASGILIYISSYIYGLGTWIFGLAVTLTLWGWVAVLIGVLMGGIGVVPIGMLAAIFHGQWGIFWTLLINLALTYSARIIGAVLISSYEKWSRVDEAEANDKVIDIKVDTHKRVWKDIE